ncbi:hypothetical protein [Thermococcus nautili]|uniref:Uncharacterized protein n=1 Tax=Thermococcus nautili TaxID=195522 RepID=W8P1L5_9EURY|nr:hypothetical protein [Thermococcus nautili]AHL22656.1 hypothetical protein BD01_1039 [Thermococcus nautili]CAI1493300.1 conserved protein of unknown function [Thermococcus nautili]
MESRTAEMPFSADWEAVRWVTSKPRELFKSLPFEAEVSGEEPFDVQIRIRRRLFKFEFSGRMNVAFADSTATYVMKGPKGLLILSASVDGDVLQSRASADLVERFLGRKLEALVNGFALAVCRFSESYRRIVGKILPTGEGEFYIKDMASDDLPHLLRYLRFSLGNGTFSLRGKGNGEEFRITVENDVVKSIEHESSGGSAIVEVNKPLLGVGEDDFSGLELGGEYFLSVLRR